MNQNAGHQKAPTKPLAEFLERTNFDDIPGPVRERAKYFFLDNLANMIGGISLTPGRVMAEYASTWGGADEATVFATRRRLPAPLAAFVNGYLVNVLDFDDDFEGIAHPGSTSAPAAISIAEKLAATGTSLITAFILAYEVQLRIGMATQPSAQRYKQVWGISSWQTFGAVSAAAKVMNLNSESIRNAFGLAGSAAPMPYVRKEGLEIEERPFAWSKNNYHHANLVGVSSAELASRGFLGNRFILDGERGFWIIMSSDQCNWDRFTQGLGEEWLLPRTSQKPYACCRWAHPAIDGALALYKSGIRPDTIKKITVITFYEGIASMAVPHPVNITDAQFSLPHLVAVCFVGHSPAKGLIEKDLEESVVRHLRSLVHIEEDPDMTQAYLERSDQPAKVVVELLNGEQFEHSVPNPKGVPSNPVSDSETEQKFLDLVTPVLGRKNAQAAMSGVLDIEHLSDVRAWIRSWCGDS